MVGNKTKFILLAIAVITSLLMCNVFQAYAAPGQQKVPTLVVFVHVINDDWGTMMASDFVVAVTAKDPSPSIFSGSEIGTTVTVKNSAYSVTELAVKGYKVSYSPGCSGRINMNEAKTCVITNDDIAPHLKVIKHVINDNGSLAKASDFSIFVYGNNPTPGYFSGSEMGTDVKIGPGYYGVNENWNPEYISSYSPDCNGEIRLGENKTCIITNDDIPKGQLTVIKHVINDNSGTANAFDFTMVVDGNNPSPGSFQGSEIGTNVTIYEGYYNVWEYSRSDYSQSNSIDCSGYIRGGEIKTCTITNDDLQPAHLIVIKNVINDNSGTASASDFTMFVYGNNPSPSVFMGSEAGTDVIISSGSYSVEESFDPKYYRFSSFDCSGFINPGETRTCTITNDDIPPPDGGINGSVAYGPFTWDASNFPGFWHEDGISGETLSVNQQDLSGIQRFINRDNLVYSSTKKVVPYKVYTETGLTIWGGLDVSGFPVMNGGYYGKVGWLGKSYVAVNGVAFKLSEIVMEQSLTDFKDLNVNERWNLGNGYNLTLIALDITQRQAWFILSNNIETISEFIVEEGQVYTVRINLAGENDAPFFVTYFDSISDDSVRLKYTWLISDNVMIFNSGDSFGYMEVRSANSDGFYLGNENPIILSSGSTINLLDVLYIVVNDNPSLEYYPVMNI